MLKLRIRIMLTRIKVVQLKVISFLLILIKGTLAKNIANNLVNIDFELKERNIL